MHLSQHDTKLQLASHAQLFTSFSHYCTATLSHIWSASPTALCTIVSLKKLHLATWKLFFIWHLVPSWGIVLHIIDGCTPSQVQQLKFLLPGHFVKWEIAEADPETETIQFFLDMSSCSTTLTIWGPDKAILELVRHIACRVFPAFFFSWQQFWHN